MPLYTYRGLGMNGELLRGYLCGECPDDVRSALHQRQIEPISLRRLWLPRSQPKELILFFLHLRYALQAGNPLTQALGMAQSSFRGSFGLLIQTLKEHLGQGKMLSDACRLYPWAFSGTLIALLHVGEQSGQLSNACQQAHEYLQKIRKTQKSWRKALAQPILNLSFFMIALISLSQGLIPIITDIAIQDHNTVPWATRLLMGLTQWEPFYALYGIVASFLILLIYMHPLKIPAIGGWIARKNYWAIFSSLVLLLKVNIPLLKALTIVEQSLIYRGTLHKNIAKLLRDIQEGQTLAQAGKHLPHFSIMYLQFLQAGESTGQLVQSLDLLANFIQDDIKKTIDRCLLWINPMSLLLIGLCFWVLIEATIYPLYNDIEANIACDFL